MNDLFKTSVVIRKGYLTRLLLLLICIFLFSTTISSLYLYFDIYRPLNTHYSAVLSIARGLKETLIIRTIKISAFFYLLVAAGIVILGILYTHRIAGPLHRIKIYAKSIKEGNLDSEIKFRRKDAVLLFAESLNNMTESYNNRVTELNSEIAQLKAAIVELKSLTEKGKDTETTLKKVLDTDGRIKKLLSAIRL